MIAILLLHPVVPDGKIPEISAAADPKCVLEIVKTVLSDKKDLAAKFEPILTYIGCIAGSLIDRKEKRISFGLSTLSHTLPLSCPMVGPRLPLRL